jgi:uncharacterized protein (DUF1810 family)
LHTPSKLTGTPWVQLNWDSRRDSNLLPVSRDNALKLRSSLTIFLRAGGGELFEAALERWFSGQAGERTDSLLDPARI